jgi:hypothetical protein
MCLYYSKGTADYVGVWDYDEFFQPRGTNKNLIDVVKAMESPFGPIPYFHPTDADPLAMYRAGWKPQRGMADGEAHPFCYIMLKSEVTFMRPDSPPDTRTVINISPTKSLQSAMIYLNRKFILFYADCRFFLRSHG